MEVFAISSGERFNYEPRMGWNLELDFDEGGNVKAMFRFVKYGNVIDMSPKPDNSLEAKRDCYTDLKVACDLKNARFVVNPHDIPNASWEVNRAHTIEEFEFLVGERGLPSNAKEMLGLMQFASEELRKFESNMQEAYQLITQPIYEASGVTKNSMMVIDERGENELVKGFRVKRVRDQYKGDDIGNLTRVFEQRFVSSLEYYEHRETWQKPGEFMEIWLVKNPDKQLEENSGLDYSSIIIIKYHTQFPWANFMVTTAKQHPLVRLFSIMEDRADYVRRPDFFYQKTIEEAVYGIK